MKAYLCDSCRTVITDPYDVRMKEFYIGCDYEVANSFPFPATCKKKIHLCEQCYTNLRNIGQKEKHEIER